MREQYLGRLQSGAAQSMSRVAGLWGNSRGGQFLDEDEEAERGGWGRRNEPLSSSSPSPKVPEAKVPQPPMAAQSDTWNQAATIRAQLEEELKKEQVSRGSPAQRTRVFSSDGRERTSSAGDLGPDADKARKKDKSEKKRHKPKGSPDAFFAVPSPGFPEAEKAEGQATGPLSAESLNDLWGQSASGGEPALPADLPSAKAMLKKVGEPAAAAKASKTGAFDGVWDFAPSGAWPQKPTSPAPPAASTPPASATAAATSLADGFATEGVAEGFRWSVGSDQDSPSGAADAPLLAEVPQKPISVPTSPCPPVIAAPSPERERSVSEATSETQSGMFDDAILAALAALPQQALVGVLQRLAQRRPAEVALAFGRGIGPTTSASAPVLAAQPHDRSAVVSSPTPASEAASPLLATPPASPDPPMQESSAGGAAAHETVADTSPAQEPPSEAPADSGDNEHVALVDDTSSEGLSPVPAPAAALAADTAPASGDSVSAFVQGAGLPEANVWPAAAPSSAAGGDVFDWPAAPALGSSGAAPQAASLWPAPAASPEAGAGAAAASLWPSAGGSASASPWPAPAPAAKTGWPMY